jgi:hypothetical protein
VNYLLKLKKGNQTYQFIVYPVYKGEDYNAAMAKYMRSIRNMTGGSAKERESTKQKEEYEARLKQQQRNSRTNYTSAETATGMVYSSAKRKYVKTGEGAEPRAKSINNIYRAFEVTGFGVWNCDNRGRRTEAGDSAVC